MLIVEDSEDDTRLIVRELERGGYEPDWERVETPEAMKKALAVSDWDVIVSDHRLPRFGSSEALAIRGQAGSEAPFVVVSGTIGEELAVAAMKAGAYDYVMKDNLARLCATVERGLKEAEERRERKRIEEEMRASEVELRALFEAMTDVILILDAEGRYLKVAPTEPSLLYKPPAEMLGKTVHEIFSLEQADEFLGHIRRALHTRRTVNFEYSLQIGNRQMWFDCAISPMLEDKVVWVARDVTERARAQELLEERVTALSRMAANLTFEWPTEDTLDALAQSAVNAATAVACGVVLVDEKADAPHLFGSYGLPEGYTAGLQTAYRAGARSPSLEAFRTRQPRLVRDTRRILLADPLYAPVHHLLRQAPWDITYNLPLVSRGRALGAIFFCYLLQQEPGDDEKVFLKAVADQAAVAVENAHLFAETRGKAVLEERQRLARELHDSVSQALYGIALGAKSAREWLDDDPGEVAEPLDYVLSLAEAGITEMRALIFELRPESLESEGVVAALEKQAATLEARHKIEVEVDLCDEPDAPLETKEALYRIAQEALHNIVKHARASNVLLKMQSDFEQMTLEISDDGIGFDAKGAFPGHLGLRSMRERASRLGGMLKVESAPDKGTRICTRVPI
ncbi:MAG TPA: PAS domain-containing protein [Rubrobacter sp.]|nr:PAS domain-containing protein [Rubrobacter sp.]